MKGLDMDVKGLAQRSKVLMDKNVVAQLGKAPKAKGNKFGIVEFSAPKSKGNAKLVGAKGNHKFI